jgi:pyruvate/2-oxoglutarate dehydrogenase complex dihydrolipoamide acyltransferase (E2) component
MSKWQAKEGGQALYMATREHQRLNNKATEQFADAFAQSYKAVSDRAIAAQERNVQLTEEFFKGVVSNLRTQTNNNLQLSEQIADQQQRQVQAVQTLTRETVDAYMDFANSMLFGFWQRGSTRGAEVEATEAAERKSEEFREVDLQEGEGSGSSGRALADDVEEAAWGADATDAAQRKAEEFGIDLATVEGTGANGRITVGDVERAVNKEGEKR